MFEEMLKLILRTASKAVRMTFLSVMDGVMKKNCKAGQRVRFTLVTVDGFVMGMQMLLRSCDRTFRL